MSHMIQGRDSLIIGIDVGSTTVKATVVDPESKQILWSDYQRHHTKQAEKVLEMLMDIGSEFPEVEQANVRVFATGSGSGPIAPHIGAKFVQEVNAVTMAAEQLHPEVGSVIELGGQDAKIIIFKKNEETGQSQAYTSMNDKCASGTGAMIDKCLIKVGMPMESMGKLHFDDSKLHHVAAKCGVFAETDIVNLVKSGIPSPEIMCSLADAIVMQNLSVLTRGNTLRHHVLLLGGPNTYLTFLQECWRKRIPQTWQERGYDYPKDTSAEELIFVPEHSQYYAAYGAVLYGMYEPVDTGVYLGLNGLKEFIAHGRQAKLSGKAGPPLVSSGNELEQFQRQYNIPGFTLAAFTPGQKVKAVIGLDGGSTSSKAVLIDEQGEILLKEYQLSKGNPLEDTKEMLKRIRDKVEGQGADLEIIGFGATGYAADVLEKTLKADVNIVETVAHMKSAVHQFGDIDVICDIGGQDIKVLFLKNRDIRNFKLSNQCSAGNGMLLQAMADQFGIPVQEYADMAFGAALSPKFSYGCAVFLDADRVNFQKEGFSKEEMLAGLALVLPKNVWQYVVQIPRMAELGRKFVLQGGTQYNLAAVKAQVDYIKQRVPGAEIYVHPHPGEAGAIGAAMETLRVVKRRGYSTFLGLNSVIDLRYESRNDESTRCQFCHNHCSRTFIDSKTPDGQTARYISGFSCEKGTVEDKEAVIKVTRERQELKKQFPNLVEYEARRMFQHFYDAEPLPEPDLPMDDVRLKRGWLRFGGRRTRPDQRPFARSSTEAIKRRSRIRIGIPRVLNIWSTAPFWRSYFETLGIDGRNIVFSDQTSGEMWQEGGKYGSIDPCYPSKVAQAHVHNLLFKHHEQHPLDYIFFPCITHIPTYLQNVMDSTSCPVVAGSPNVIKAAFTKEVDFFRVRGIMYLDPAVTFTEPNLLKSQLYEAFGEHLQITRDESDFAVMQGWKAMELFDAEMQEKGRTILEQVERDNRLAILMIGRPYHSDPGLNHNVLEEFQVLGYPILSMRSIPKDEAWLNRFFSDDLNTGRVKQALEVSDVWPENFSSSSVQKVWAAKFAARHSHVAVLDLSSFKCGHDAPTYGLIDSIISAGGNPYSALHDIDANKPGGSIKIRVKTYAHSLGLHEERLQDLARKKAELQQRLELFRVQNRTKE
ncbi:BadF/BadG/BcrA/BcrD ATPase family protein [Paenibacillus jilunlii]|uniref:Activator of 2-hydroxyglutaryl-CoA dehydratase (HSP70-class ATPase domain) n=1 Tax=Paenibacillus jilunlii TaxID=682956 RepID=A0A1G9K4C2_9BACL|nr:BadF/BadG/BcrA/BcrD ATPase family protein [Paenibacillus jilunlii]KWX70052.1 CoA activase [Paenibacillus jilunlii]SDL44549.1 Activator of 2-hydroxyglutaryl-CoA dehydratase (HSP70-class ATPase domain) [Paenibacillus jilunlii]